MNHELVLESINYLTKIVPEKTKFSQKLESCRTSLNFAAPEMFITHLQRLWEFFEDEITFSNGKALIPDWVHVAQTVVMYTMMLLDSPPVEETMVRVPITRNHENN